MPSKGSREGEPEVDGCGEGSEFVVYEEGIHAVWAVVVEDPSKETFMRLFGYALSYVDSGNALYGVVDAFVSTASG